ncbi:hypothetical protein ACU4GI_38505 [Cupriavidus basilensis]
MTMARPDSPNSPLLQRIDADAAQSKALALVQLRGGGVSFHSREVHTDLRCQAADFLAALDWTTSQEAFLAAFDRLPAVVAEIVCEELKASARALQDGLDPGALLCLVNLRIAMLRGAAGQSGAIAAEGFRPEVAGPEKIAAAAKRACDWAAGAPAAFGEGEADHGAA